jgi:hypothetical protein
VEDALQRLLDKQEITEVLTRYMRAVDRGDLDALRACYLPGAVEEHGGVFTGTAADYVDSVARTLTHPKAITTHVLSNILIELDDDRASAFVECYVTAFARVRAGDTLTVARMLDVFGKDGGRWGIRHRRLLWEWNHDMDTTESWIFGMLVPDAAVLDRGAKFPGDPVYGAVRRA